MVERLYRAQLLLQPSQHQRLREIAEREGKSISEVARGVIRRGLESMTADEQALRAQRTEALGNLQTIRETVASTYGVYEGNLIDEARQNREEHLEPKDPH
jgi:hypothetical protein